MANSPLANQTQTKRVLSSFNLDAKYKFGQNFLIDDNIVGRILELANIQTDIPILEVGPGIGTLTLALLQKSPIISVEFDDDMVNVLKQTIGAYTDNFAVIKKDALKLNYEDIEIALRGIGAKDTNGIKMPKMLVANLPYQIAATLILDYFERFDFLKSMVVMVQSEVADRICAKIGTKDYGAYSIKIRMFAQMCDRFQVSPTCFYPAPRVESSVICLRRNESNNDKQLLNSACKIADAAFAQRRKTIRNSMCASFDKSVVDELLNQCNIDQKLRGESLSVKDYLRLGQAYIDLNLKN